MGLIATVSIIMLIVALDGAFSNGDLGVMWTCWGILAAQAVLLALLIWKRRAFWRQSRARRVAWMSAFTLASAALTVAFIWFILSLF